MESMNRKQYRRAGRRVFHKNYLLFVFLCLILSLFGTEGGKSVQLLKTKETTSYEDPSGEQVSSVLESEDVYEAIVTGDLGKAIQESCLDYGTGFIDSVSDIPFSVLRITGERICLTLTLWQALQSI